MKKKKWQKIIWIIIVAIATISMVLFTILPAFV